MVGLNAIGTEGVGTDTPDTQAIGYNPPISPNFKQVQMSIRSVVAQNNEVLSFRTNKKSFGYSKWVGSFVLPDMTEDQAREWKAWLTKIGAQGVFYVGDPDYFGPDGNVSHAGVVQQTTDDRSILIGKAFEPNVTNLFKKGDQFEVNKELKIVTKNVDSDSLGRAQLVFEPSLRNTNIRGKKIVIDEPKGEFRLDEGLSQWEDQNVLTQIDFPFEEVV